MIYQWIYGRVDYQGNILENGGGGWSLSQPSTGVSHIIPDPVFPSAGFSVQVPNAFDRPQTSESWIATDSSLKAPDLIVITGYRENFGDSPWDAEFEFSAMMIDPGYQSEGVERIVWGWVDGTGAVVDGVGYTSNLDSPAVISITFDVPMRTANYGVSLTVAEDITAELNITNRTTAGFQIEIYRIRAPQILACDVEFFVILSSGAI